MTDEIVLAERHGRVLEITLNRPPANAINTALSRAIYARLRELQDSPDLSVAILRGGFANVGEVAIGIEHRVRPTAARDEQQRGQDRRQL